MYYEILLGLRYLKTHKGTGYLSFMSIVSIIGITLGVAALIIVMSVMDGFQTNIKNKILISTPHLRLTSKTESLPEWPQILKTAMDIKGISGGAPFREEEGAFTAKDESPAPIVIKGVNPEFEPLVSMFDIKEQMSELNRSVFGVVMPEAKAKIMGLHIGDEINILTHSYDTTPGGLLPRMRKFRLVAMMPTSMDIKSLNTFYITLRDFERLMRSQTNAIQFRLDDMYDAANLEVKLKDALGEEKYRINSWVSDNLELFKALKSEKIMMLLVLSLIVLVALFNVVSMLMMTVMNKSSEIAILKTIGASNRSIQMIFTIQGLCITVGGTIFGVVLGVLLTLNLDRIVGTIMRLTGNELPPMIQRAISLPAQFNIANILVLTVISVILGYLVTLIPSSRAAKIHPAEALRYE